MVEVEDVIRRKRLLNCHFLKVDMCRFLKNLLCSFSLIGLIH